MAAGILEEMETKFADHNWGSWKMLRKTDGVFLGYTGLWHSLTKINHNFYTPSYLNIQEMAMPRGH